MMTPEEIKSYILKTYPHINPIDTWGELSFFVNPEMKLKRGTYFCTLKSQDGANDKSSNLNRDGIFRLNIGITQKSFEKHFGSRPKRPLKGGIISGDYDFTKVDVLMPHPIYGWLNWISILNPSEKTFAACKDYLDVAYDKAQKLTQKKIDKIKSCESQI